MKQGFTLIEIIIVIIIVGILAAVGITQYSNMVEQGRIAEAKVRLGTMRQLAAQYYLEKGTDSGLQNTDLGVDNTCSSSSFYSYRVAAPGYAYWDLVATRCTSGGKTPNTSRQYKFGMRYWPATGAMDPWACYYSDGTMCFGYIGSQGDPGYFWN